MSMESLAGFGHFFGFAATVNYATTIFKEFQIFLQNLLMEFEVEKLSEQKVLYEQGYSIYKATLVNLIQDDVQDTVVDADTLANREKKIELKRMKVQGETLLINAEEAEIHATNFLNEIRSSIPYKKNFENRFQPLFPLAGTFSVIFLLFSAFAEANHHDYCICFNTIFLVGIIASILAIGNYYGWFLTKNRDVNYRTFILNLWLVIATILLWLFSNSITKFHVFEMFDYGYVTQTIILIFAIGLASLGFLAIVLKMIRINFIARKKYKTFKTANNHLEKYIELLRNHTATSNR